MMNTTETFQQWLDTCVAPPEINWLTAALVMSELLGLNDTTKTNGLLHGGWRLARSLWGCLRGPVDVEVKQNLEMEKMD